jgi:predicted nucleic acid-binding protein
VLFDSDIIIWVLRGHAGAAAAVQRATQRAVSLMTYLELVEGALDRQDLNLTRALLLDNEIAILPLSESIGQRAATYMEEHALANGLDAGDAIIAATAIEHGMPLCTANRKHYQRIAGLELKVFRP